MLDMLPKIDFESSDITDEEMDEYRKYLEDCYEDDQDDEEEDLTRQWKFYILVRDIAESDSEHDVTEEEYYNGNEE